MGIHTTQPINHIHERGGILIVISKSLSNINTKEILLDYYNDVINFQEVVAVGAIKKTLVNYAR